MTEYSKPARYDCAGCDRCRSAGRNTTLARVDWHRERAEHRLLTILATALMIVAIAVCGIVSGKVTGA